MATAVNVFAPWASVAGNVNVPSGAKATDVPLTFSDLTPLLSVAVPVSVADGLSVAVPLAGAVNATTGLPALSSTALA